MPGVDYRYRCTVARVVDGDTLDVDVDLGFFASMRVRVRVRGVNAPEVSTAEGRASRAALTGFLPVGMTVVCSTFKPDKYGGRWDADVLVLVKDGGAGIDVAGWLVEHGLAVVRVY